MPSVSKKQHNFMAAVAKNPAFAKKVGVKPSVGEEFLKADKGKTFKQGGTMMMKKTAAMAMRNEKDEMKRVGAKERDAKEEMKRVRGEMAYDKAKMMMAKGGKVHSDIAKDKPMMKKVAKAEVKAHEKKMHSMKKGGMAYSKGGQLSKADGCAVKGKSKGKMVKMAYGGKC
jgi:hypothetical protein